MFDPNQQYPAPQMGGLGASSPIMAAMLQQYMAEKAMNAQQPQQSSGQTMAMMNGQNPNWSSSMPQQGMMGSPQLGGMSGQPVNPPMPSLQVTNGN